MNFVIESEDRKNREIVDNLIAYVAVMSDEPTGQIISFDKIYHDLNRMLGNEK